MINWKEYNESIVEKVHGKVYYYRKLYEGEHAELFPRARHLIEKGEIIEVLKSGKQVALNVQTPYIIANISKVIPEVTATLVSRSIKDINTSIEDQLMEEEKEKVDEEVDEMIDGTEDDNPENSEIVDLQQELIKQIVENSRLEHEHWGNLVQHQVDGGLVGVPVYDDRGIRIEFKARDVYFPHEDGLGADLVYKREIEGEKYLHVYRERVENGNLKTTNLLYKMEEGKELELLDPATTVALLGLKKLGKVYEGRGRPLIEYWPNEKTFMNPLGVSCLKNQEGKQDEINWTLTRNSLTFERNGKPRIVVPKEVMERLKEIAFDRYGDESKIDSRDLEVTTYGENGEAIDVIQIDVTKIGDVEWVKDLIKMMLMETQTSERAIDFYMDNQGTGSQSGVAKYYDLFLSLLKSERIQDEYIYFLKQLIKSALWIASSYEKNVVIEEPMISTREMVPVSRKEVVEENTLAFEKGTQSLETTIRRLNPQASEEWIQEELERIEGGSDDSTSLAGSRMALEGFLDYRNRMTQRPDDSEEPEEEPEEEA